MQNNYLAPDGYRYAIRFQDGSILEQFNGQFQRSRNLREILSMRMRQMASHGRHDEFALVRRRPGEPWQEVASG